MNITIKQVKKEIEFWTQFTKENIENDIKTNKYLAKCAKNSYFSYSGQMNMLNILGLIDNETKDNLNDRMFDFYINTKEKYIKNL